MDSLHKFSDICINALRSDLHHRKRTVFRLCDVPDAHNIRVDVFEPPNELKGLRHLEIWWKRLAIAQT